MCMFKLENMGMAQVSWLGQNGTERDVIDIMPFLFEIFGSQGNKY